MRVYRTIALCLLTVVAFASVGVAQDIPKTINGGVLNGKAIALPKPAYPDEAKAAKSEGTVAIKVTIDEEGNVVEAEPQEQSSMIRTRDANGDTSVAANTLPDAMLVESALAAAKEARFSPTRLSGHPVKVTGVIVYNFVAVTDAEGRPMQTGILANVIHLPKPPYPRAAAAVRAEGTVSVQVTIDESGDVVSAEAISGHPLLRSAAVEAAKDAKFRPTIKDGIAVPVTGVITYNFVAPPKRSIR